MTRNRHPVPWSPPTRLVVIVACWVLLLLGLVLVFTSCSTVHADGVPRGTSTVPAIPVWGDFHLPGAVDPAALAAALGPAIDVPADPGTAPAVRVDPPPTAPTGLHGEAFAPEGMTGCDEMAFYRAQAGLPARFDQLGYRESRCINRDDVRTFCCYGYWQLNIPLHLQDARMRPLLAACGVDSYADVNSATPADRQRQACAAAALYDVVGYSAWAL